MKRAIDLRPQAEETAYIGLGANLGDCLRSLQLAIEAIARIPLTYLVACSHFYLTEPVDAPGPDFTNAVAGVRTRLSAVELLLALQGLEQDFKRVRPAGQYHAPRTLDLDLLCFGAIRSSERELLLPHPRMSERAFVLVPLSELVPMDFPIGAERLDQCLARVSAQRIRRLDTPPSLDFLRRR